MNKAVRKTKVLLYSDCSFFAGCENMPAVLLNSPAVRKEFDIALAYRYSPGYAAGLAARAEGGGVTIPLLLPACEAMSEGLRRMGLGIVSGMMRFLGIFFLLRFLFALYAFAALFFFFRKMSPDILHINNGGYPGAYSCLAAAAAARAAGIGRVVFVVNNTAVPYTRLSRRLERAADRLVVRCVSLFVTGSRYSGGKLRETLLLPDNKVLSIPNGVAVRPVMETPDEVRKRLGIPAGATVLGTVAVLEPRKGHRYLLEALALAKAELPGGPGFVLLIEGVGRERAGLEEQAAALGLGDKVRFLGREAEIFDLMRVFDALVLPSIAYEDFPNVVLEAMGLGKPVIGTRLAGMPEQILDGETGVIVPPGDAQALAAAMIRLLADPELRAGMGRKGRERFEALFSRSRAEESYIALYRRLMLAPE